VQFFEDHFSKFFVTLTQGLRALLFLASVRAMRVFETARRDAASWRAVVPANFSIMSHGLHTAARSIPQARGDGASVNHS
jgi:hypothetical protein